MIKAEATVVGTVKQAAQLKQNGKGGYNYAATLKTSIPVKEGGLKEVYLHLSAPQITSAGLERITLNQHVLLKGIVYFRKDGDIIYLNMNVKECSEADLTLPDNISGELIMIGVVGSKGAEVKNGKNGKPVTTFSAYSSDGDGDNRVFTWVRFVRFNGDVDPFLVPKALIQASGVMELQYYKEKLSISCRANELKPYIKSAPADAPY